MQDTIDLRGHSEAIRLDKAEKQVCQFRNLYFMKDGRSWYGQSVFTSMGAARFVSVRFLADIYRKDEDAKQRGYRSCYDKKTNLLAGFNVRYDQISHAIQMPVITNA